MATCHVCGKKRLVGNNVSHSSKKTKRIFKPNLQRIRIVTNGVPKRAYVCTSCIKSGLVTKAL